MEYNHIYISLPILILLIGLVHSIPTFFSLRKNDRMKVFIQNKKSRISRKKVLGGALKIFFFTLIIPIINGTFQWYYFSLPISIIFMMFMFAIYSYPFRLRDDESTDDEEQYKKISDGDIKVYNRIKVINKLLK
tara:strand:- start:9016 stop:9417 length:402 start_codon:yes stop_codon:yes gene_type:complete